MRSSYASDDELLADGGRGACRRRPRSRRRPRTVLGEVQVRGVTDRCFGLRTAKWVAAQAKVDHPADRSSDSGSGCGCGCCRSSTRRSLRVRSPPTTPRCWPRPRRTRGSVMRLRRPQSYWVDQAAETSFVDWSHQLKQTVRLLDQDGGYDPDRDRDRLRARFTTFDDGLTRLSGGSGRGRGARGPAAGRGPSRPPVPPAQARRGPHVRSADAESGDPPGHGAGRARASRLDRRSRDTTTGPAVDVTLVVEATKPVPAGGVDRRRQRVRSVRPVPAGQERWPTA